MEAHKASVLDVIMVLVWFIGLLSIFWMPYIGYLAFSIVAGFYAGCVVGKVFTHGIR